MKTSGIEKTVRKVLTQPELLDIFSLRWGLDRRAETLVARVVGRSSQLVSLALYFTRKRIFGILAPY